MMNKRCCHLLWFALLFANAALAAEAGQVIFAAGSVTAEREPPVALAKGDTILVEDTIATGEASRAQFLMIDGAKIAMRPNSRLRIEEYAFPSGAGATPGQPVVTTSNDRSVMSLVKGGFRTITGAIGKDDEESYEVRTPVGVLGIRGTDYAAVFCRADCTWAPGVTAGAPIEDGLYLGVTDGIIFFRNANGEIELRAGEFAFIPLTDRRARRLQNPPAVLLDDRDLDFEAGEVTRPEPPPDDDDTGRPPGDDDGGSAGPPTDPDGSGTGYNARFSIRRAPPESGSAQPGKADQDDGTGGSREPPEQSIIGTDPDGSPVDITPGEAPPDGNRTISYSSGPLGLPDAAFSGTQINSPGEYLLDAGNDVIGFVAPYPGATAPDTGVFAVGTAAIVESGFDSVTVLRWGRWSGGTASITLTGGVDASENLGNQSIHWVSGPVETVPPTMPISGVANYSLIGSTSPTDSFGNTGVLGSATFQADFTRQVVVSTIMLDINSFNWTATGNGTIGAQAGLPAHLFQGVYGNVVITGAAGTLTGTGMFGGFFSEPGPTSNPSFPGGVGMTYALQDLGASMNVSGALVFGNP
jgi:hypothetical protein